MTRIFQSIMTTFKHWAKNNFRKTTIWETDILIWMKSDCSVVTKDEVFNVIHKCHLRTEHSGRDTTFFNKIVLKCIVLTILIKLSHKTYFIFHTFYIYLCFLIQ
jgi:hypothetical protein